MIRKTLFPIPLALALLPTPVITAAEWPQWRGPKRDGICTETGLLEVWKGSGPPLLWSGSGLGKGYSSVAIAGGKIFTLGDRGKGAQLIALDLERGKELWAAKVGGGEPNSTPTVDRDFVYALGRDGDLLCAEAASGKEVWRKSLEKDLGGKMMSGWGYSESPLVDGDRLVCTPGGDASIIAALDRKTGEVIWKAKIPGNVGDRGKDGAGYSSVVISEAKGVKQYIQLVGRGLISVAAADGKFLWAYNKIANDTANIPTPIVKGDFVFCSSGYNTGAALLEVIQKGKALEPREVYFLPAKEMQNHHGGMVLVGDYVYCGSGQNEGFPVAIELRTGKFAWKPGRGPGKGSAAVLYADGDLYFRYQDGTMALIEANPKEYKVKGTFQIATKNGESWPHPVISNGKLYLRDQDALHCYRLK